MCIPGDPLQLLHLHILVLDTSVQQDWWVHGWNVRRSTVDTKNIFWKIINEHLCLLKPHLAHSSEDQSHQKTFFIYFWFICRTRLIWSSVKIDLAFLFFFRPSGSNYSHLCHNFIFGKILARKKWSSSSSWWINKGRPGCLSTTSTWTFTSEPFWKQKSSRAASPDPANR